MKPSNILYCLLIIATIAVINGCIKSASSIANFSASSSVTSMLQNKWTYSYFTSCPQNSTMGAPCFEFNMADTALYGNGSVTLSLGADNKLYWVKEGVFTSQVFSYLFSSTNDTLDYKMLTDSSLILLNKDAKAVDTVKINTLTNHLLVLTLSSTGEYGYNFETDSLHR